MVALNRRDRSLAVVGAYVIAAALGFVVLFAAATNRSLADRRSELWIELPTAEGLKKGDAVLFRGVQVGEVKRIEFADDGGVIVRTMLTRTTPMTANGRARLVAADMFGRQSIVLDYSAGGRALQAGDTLYGQPPVSLTARMEGVANQLERIIGDTTVTAVHELLNGITTTAAALTDAMRTAQSTLDGQRQPLQRTLEHTAGITANLRAATDSIELAAMRDHAQRTMQQLSTLTARLDSASVAVLRTAERVSAGSGSIGMLANDDALYRRTVATLESFEALLQDLRKNPKRYINISVF